MLLCMLVKKEKNIDINHNYLYKVFFVQPEVWAMYHKSRLQLQQWITWWVYVYAFLDTFCIICKHLKKSPVYSFWKKASAKVSDKQKITSFTIEYIDSGKSQHST